MYMYANTHMYTALHAHVQYPPQACELTRPAPHKAELTLSGKSTFVAVVGGEDVDTKGEQRLQGKEGQETDQVWSPAVTFCTDTLQLIEVGTSLT